MAGKGTVSIVKAIREYFFAGESVSTVMAEMKKLTDADKKELGEGAAKELGYEGITTSTKE